MYAHFQQFNAKQKNKTTDVHLQAFLRCTSHLPNMNIW